MPTSTAATWGAGPSRAHWLRAARPTRSSWSITGPPTTPGGRRGLGARGPLAPPGERRVLVGAQPRSEGGVGRLDRVPRRGRRLAPRPPRADGGGGRRDRGAGHAVLLRQALFGEPRRPVAVGEVRPARPRGPRAPQGCLAVGPHDATALPHPRHRGATRTRTFDAAARPSGCPVAGTPISCSSSPSTSRHARSPGAGSR